MSKMLPLFGNNKVKIVQDNSFVANFDVLVACEDTLIWGYGVKSLSLTL